MLYIFSNNHCLTLLNFIYIFLSLPQFTRVFLNLPQFSYNIYMRLSQGYLTLLYILIPLYTHFFHYFPLSSCILFYPLYSTGFCSIPLHSTVSLVCPCMFLQVSVCLLIVLFHPKILLKGATTKNLTKLNFVFTISQLKNH